MMLENGSAVEYDWLVLALGSDSVFFGIEGVKELCLPFNTYSDAMRVSRPTPARACPLASIVDSGKTCSN